MSAAESNDHLVQSQDDQHPANMLPELCRKFYTLGWVPGTGGGASIREGDNVYLAPSGVSKELMKPEDLYVLSLAQQTDKRNRSYIRSPPSLKPSQCTPLFLAAFTKRNAGCCIHTHSQAAVLLTMLAETDPNPANRNVFQINNVEQIKAFGRGFGKKGNLDNFETLTVPIIENTPQEEDLAEPLEELLDQFPDTYAVLVRRHGVYVWGDNVAKAKAMAESLDYLFQLAVEMKKLGLPWVS